MTSPLAIAAVTAGGVVAGAGVGFFGTYLQARRSRGNALTDRLYSERSQAYREFLAAAHDCAHQIGKLSRHQEHGDPEMELPSLEERVRIAYHVDAFAAKHERVVQIVGPAPVAVAAEGVLRSLYNFRSALQDALRLVADGSGAVVYDLTPDCPYMVLLQPYRRARDAFVLAAKAELQRLSGGPS